MERNDTERIPAVMYLNMEMFYKTRYGIHKRPEFKLIVKLERKTRSSQIDVMRLESFSKRDPEGSQLTYNANGK